jgi:hypothetical protein
MRDEATGCSCPIELGGEQMEELRNKLEELGQRIEQMKERL